MMDNQASPIKNHDTQDDIPYIVRDIAHQAKTASFLLAQTAPDTIDAVLSTLAALIKSNIPTILAANARDIEKAKDAGLTPAMIDRLMLDEKRIIAIADSVLVVRDLPCPVGKALWETVRPNGLHITRISVPIGVLGMIYESRPNVTVDAAALCLKSQNAVVLRGGSESLESSLALHALIKKALVEHGLPEGCVSMIPTRDRAAVGEMLRASGLIDVIIPRGGKALIERVMREASMPVFGHLEGLCHIYVHPSVKPDIALDVTLNAKMRRTGVCGAMETLILDQALPPDIAKGILGNLLDAGCEIVGDKLAQGLDSRITPAAPEDWTTEYLDKKLSCCVVDGVAEAVRHINTYGSHHTDSILAEDKEATAYFLHNVDSGIVIHNASTQFADGGEFGMGAEIGIGTGKLHARGPVGIEQLCTYKYIVQGNGQTRP